MRYMLHISRAVGTLVGRGGNACGVPQILADKGYISDYANNITISPKFHTFLQVLLPTALYYGYLLKQIQLGFCWCGLRITTYAQIHQLAHFPRVNFPTNQFRGFRWSVMGNHSWNLIIVGSASQHIEVRTIPEKQSYFSVEKCILVFLFLRTYTTSYCYFQLCEPGYFQL